MCSRRIILLFEIVQHLCNLQIKHLNVLLLVTVLVRVSYYHKLHNFLSDYFVVLTVFGKNGLTRCVSFA